jgi:XTP/dITP diphosphohydrolase
VKIERVVIATRNESKKVRLGRLLTEVAEQVIGLDNVRVVGKPDETGETAEENAEIKASYYALATGLPVLSEDESLWVDFLPMDKQPGVHVRRVNGKDEVSDEKLLAYWEMLVAAAPVNKRTGHWHIAYCLGTPNGRVHTGVLDHPIMFFFPSSKVRLPGWPMSSLQGPVMFGKPDSELTEEERKQKDRRTDELIKDKLRELFK